MNRAVLIIPVFNEKEKIRFVLERIQEEKPPVDTVVVDDCSDDGVEEVFAAAGGQAVPPRADILVGGGTVSTPGTVPPGPRTAQAPEGGGGAAFPATTVIKHKVRSGVGSAIRTGIEEAFRREAEVVVVMAGNGKDDPAEISKLLAKIDQGFDYVQGSRYLPGGESRHLPTGRMIAIKLATLTWTLLLGHRLTDVTNGFRAYRTSFLKSGLFDISQEWLNRYELELYLHYYALRHFRFAEVPVSKVYRFKTGGYSKIRGIQDWWSLARPIFLLRLGLRR